MTENQILRNLTEYGNCYVSHKDFEKLSDELKDILNNAVGKSCNYKNGCVYDLENEIFETSHRDMNMKELIHDEYEGDRFNELYGELLKGAIC